jgi:hypothetical protein
LFELEIVHTDSFERLTNEYTNQRIV